MKVKAYSDSSQQIQGYTFLCPGCNQRHQVTTDPTTGWQFNGNVDSPTFSPSVLVRRGHYARTPPIPGNCACDYQQRHPDEEPWQWPCGLCHSFVRDGMIQFLPDCTHALAGQTVPLPDIPIRNPETIDG